MRCAALHIGRFVNFGKRAPALYQSWDPCAGEATCEVVTGCVHEHIDRYPSCAVCAARCLEQVRGKRPGQCLSCLPDHEHCPVQVVVRELAEVTA